MEGRNHETLLLTEAEYEDARAAMAGRGKFSKTKRFADGATATVETYAGTNGYGDAGTFARVVVETPDGETVATDGDDYLTGHWYCYAGGADYNLKVRVMTKAEETVFEIETALGGKDVAAEAVGRAIVKRTGISTDAKGLKGLGMRFLNFADSLNTPEKSEAADGAMKIVSGMGFDALLKKVAERND